MSGIVGVVAVGYSISLMSYAVSVGLRISHSKLGRLIIPTRLATRLIKHGLNSKIIMGVMKMVVDVKELQEELSGFIGTEGYHKLTLGSLLATDGIAHLAKRVGAFWLIDAIASYQHKPEVRGLGIQFWTLEVKDNKAELYCVEDSGMPKIVSQKIEYTDFPTGKWDFYLANNVIMLPGEY